MAGSGKLENQPPSPLLLFFRWVSVTPVGLGFPRLRGVTGLDAIQLFASPTVQYTSPPSIKVGCSAPQLSASRLPAALGRQCHAALNEATRSARARKCEPRESPRRSGQPSPPRLLQRTARPPPPSRPRSKRITATVPIARPRRTRRTRTRVPHKRCKMRIMCSFRLLMGQRVALT